MPRTRVQAGAQSFTVPFWSDIPDIEADITTDVLATLSTAQKITAASMVVRKSFFDASWSEMSLVSELGGWSVEDSGWISPSFNSCLLRFLQSRFGDQP